MADKYVTCKKKKKQSLNSSFTLFLNRFLYSRCHEDDSPQHWSWSGPLASSSSFLTGITQGRSSYLNPNPRTPITLNGSIATSLYTHAQIHTKEQREWKTEGEKHSYCRQCYMIKGDGERRGNESSKNGSAADSVSPGSHSLQIHASTHTSVCSALSYLTKGRARRVSHSNRGTRLSLVWGAEALFPPGGVHEYLRGGERLFLFSLNRKQHQEWRESETTRAGEPDCHPVSPRLRSGIWCYNFPT